MERTKPEMEVEKTELKTAAELAMQKTDSVAEEYNRTKPEISIIDEASSFEELDALIDRNKGVQGSREFFDATTLKDIISRVRANTLGLEYVTRSEGLREKVGELLEAEKGEQPAEVERNGSRDPAVHKLNDSRMDAILVDHSDVYGFGEIESEENKMEGQKEEAETIESAEEDPSFEAIGKARLERVLARAGEARGQVEGYGKGLWEKAKDYTAKGAKAIGTGVRKLFYMSFALPEMLDASDEFFGEKYASLMEASGAKYKEIVGKIAGAKETFLNRVKAAQERRQERRNKIVQAKAAIVAEEAKLKAARWDLKSKFALF